MAKAKNKVNPDSRGLSFDVRSSEIIVQRMRTQGGKRIVKNFAINLHICVCISKTDRYQVSHQGKVVLTLKKITQASESFPILQ